MFGNAMEYLPLLIRIGTVLLAVAVVLDFLKRKWARELVSSLHSLGAYSPELALGTAELEKTCPHVKLCVRLLLSSEYNALRRTVLCVKGQQEKHDGTKRRKNRSDKLTGDERWYILPPSPAIESATQDETADRESTDTEARSTPAILREGAEMTLPRLIVGLVLAAAFAELIIHYLPQIADFFARIASLGA